MATTGKKSYYNELGQSKMFGPNETVPEGWILGRPNTGSMNKVPMPSKETVAAVYCQPGATLSSTGRHFGTSHKTVATWLRRYGIEIKNHKQASTEANNRHRLEVKPTKEELLSFYESNNQADLCKIYGVSLATMKSWLDSYEFEIKHGEKCKQGKDRQFAGIRFSKEQLEEAYDRTQPFAFTAEKLGVSVSYLKSQFKNYEIEIEKHYRSAAEIELFTWLVWSFPQFNFEHSNRTLLPPLELDIVCHEKKIAIEYCGLYWHSEFSGEKNSGYHAHKQRLCAEFGYKLITIFESDDIKKIKALLNKIFGGIQKRVFARKTEVKKLTSSDSMSFANEHHLHNGLGASHHYGLFFENELVMSVSFSKTRFNKNFEYECARMTSHSDISVVGGASKLFKYFISEAKPQSIITYADLRFGDGSVYEKYCGFTRENDSSANYWYFHPRQNILWSRIKFQKHKLKNQLAIFKSELTEIENMRANGWDRIWDCGNAVYTWRQKKKGA